MLHDALQLQGHGLRTGGIPYFSHFEAESFPHVPPRIDPDIPVLPDPDSDRPPGSDDTSSLSFQSPQTACQNTVSRYKSE